MSKDKLKNSKFMCSIEVIGEEQAVSCLKYGMSYDQVFAFGVASRLMEGAGINQRLTVELNLSGYSRLLPIEVNEIDETWEFVESEED